MNINLKVPMEPEPSIGALDSPCHLKAILTHEEIDKYLSRHKLLLEIEKVDHRIFELIFREPDNGLLGVWRNYDGDDELLEFEAMRVQIRSGSIRWSALIPEEIQSRVYTAWFDISSIEAIKNGSTLIIN